MTDTSADDTGYIHLLEGLVAILAVKAGLNPNTVMSNALQNISEAAGINSDVTQRIIEQRWVGRDLQAGVMAAKTFDMPTSDEVPGQTTPAPTPSEPVSMAQRYAQWRDRQSEGKSEA